MTRTEALDVLLVPQALRRVRQATGLRQIDVSARSGLSKAMVSAYEGGKALPSLPSLSAYLGAIGRDLSDLQEAVDEMRGFPVHRADDADARERAVGRAVLKALRGLDFEGTAESSPA
ncbi:MAG TPA: helix-turn-helix transcriptional regulator [Thermoanaerobaculia bacterium]